MKSPRWIAVSQSSFAWEREALEFLRKHLPDYDPWRAWSNLEFIDDEGRVNEVDCFVLTPAGLILIEIKSRPGTVQGDPHTWTWTTDGRRFSVSGAIDNSSDRVRHLLPIQLSIPNATQQCCHPFAIHKREPLIEAC